MYAKEDICRSSFLREKIDLFYVVSLHVISVFNAQKKLLRPNCLRLAPISGIADVRDGIMTFFPALSFPDV